MCTVDLGPIDRNVYNVGDLIDDDYVSISMFIPLSMVYTQWYSIRLQTPISRK